jgi:hypothetical protein
LHDENDSKIEDYYSCKLKRPQQASNKHAVSAAKILKIDSETIEARLVCSSSLAIIAGLAEGEMIAVGAAVGVPVVGVVPIGVSGVG